MCTSGYPSPPEEIDLLQIPELAKKFNVPVGISDHTLGTVVSVASVSLGSRLIEKHFTLRRSDGGPDSEFSIEPEGLETLVADVRTAWIAIGSQTKNLRTSEAANRCLRRSLYVVSDIQAGQQFNSSWYATELGFNKGPVIVVIPE